MKVVELRAVRGRAMVAGVPLSDRPDGRTWGLPPDLVDALQDWAQSVHTLRDPPDASDGSSLAVNVRKSPSSPATEAEAFTVSRHGRHLAARLSVVLGAPVDYCDPVTGHRVALRRVTRTPHPPPVPPLRERGNGRAGPVGTAPPLGPPAAEPVPEADAPLAEPTPWGTGLVLAALIAGLVLLANLALAAPLIIGLGVFGLVIDAAVVAGLVPALWLNRHVPTWRWAVYGAFVGMAVAWVLLAAQTL